MNAPDGAGTDRAEADEMMLKLVQREYRKCCELEELTGQMAEALDRDDQVSFGMLLRMRGEAMNEIEKVRRDRSILFEACDGLRERYEKLNRGYEISDMTVMEQRILALSKSRQEALRRAKEADRRVSMRLAGDRSYYSS